MSLHDWHICNASAWPARRRWSFSEVPSIYSLFAVSTLLLALPACLHACASRRNRASQTKSRAGSSGLNPSCVYCQAPSDRVLMSFLEQLSSLFTQTILYEVLPPLCCEPAWGRFYFTAATVSKGSEGYIWKALALKYILDRRKAKYPTWLLNSLCRRRGSRLIPRAKLNISRVQRHE